ncbi:MAG: class I SAM-dependent methyltransferase [Betaproteobacteria bacterium]
MNRLLLALRKKISGVNKMESLLNYRIDSLSEQLTRLARETEVSRAHLDSLFRDYLPSRIHESFDVRFMARVEVGLSSARFFNAHLYDKQIFESDLELLQSLAPNVRPQDLVLEFGVFSGRTINALAESLPHHALWGFDSFEGLPETWRSDFSQGTFKVDALPTVRENVNLMKGLFDKTLPAFLEKTPGEVGFVHIDCDLYSSTKTVLGLLKDRLRDEALLVFDEYFNYPGWEQHEYKAFSEFIDQSSFKFEYLGCNPRHQQVAVMLLRR